jgi:superfamily II DNA or RNA helicase
MLRNTDFKVVYSSGEDEPAEFFLDALLESKSFDLGLGYFSSSGFRALSIGFAYFISRNNGKMRIIINDVLSPEDKSAIEKGLISKPEDLIESKIIEDIIRLEQILSGSDRHFFNCISWLIATKRLEMIAIAPKNNSIGIAHQKFGIFRDEGENKVAFSGSANFSSNAMFNNIESLSCYKSWTGEFNENARLTYFELLFNKIWKGDSEVIKIIPLEKVKTSLLEKFPVSNIQELIDAEQVLINESAGSTVSVSLHLKLEELRAKLQSDKENTPAFPKDSKPRDYQVEAFYNWQKSDFVGFFEMATGTGKTITALNCALELYKQEGKYQILILVPTLPLADQWVSEALSFRFSNIIVANSKNKNWVETVLHEINKNFIENFSYCIITTYQTFNMEKFQSVINRLDKTTLFIADEAHNLGTVRSQGNFPHKFMRRIGLSATPERHFDEQGTDALLSFFNAKEKPTFRLDMLEAIDKGFLCQYYYYPKIVTLTETELEEYKEISKKLLRYFDKRGGGFQDNPIVASLMLKRKRIIQKAQNKLDVFRSCLNELLELRSTLKYTLVYVPEGRPTAFDDADQRLINEYSEVISTEYHLSQHQYIGVTKNRTDVLNRFSSGKIGILTAMKCLDEGVDVKRTEIAIFCASTSNPRQFIQRRGRILRVHPDKKFSYIYDMIVVPDISSKYFDDSLSMEKNILAGELKRVYEFASMSINKYQALKTLEEVANQYKIDIFSTQISGSWA